MASFRVPWLRDVEHLGFFVVEHGDRYLGSSGFPAPREHDEDDDVELPALGLAVEAFSSARSAAESIVGVYFS